MLLYLLVSFPILLRALLFFSFFFEKNYRKHGSASYIVREVCEVCEREIQRDTERDRQK